MLVGQVRLSVGLVAAQQAAGRYPVRRPTEWQQAVPTANKPSGGQHFGNCTTVPKQFFGDLIFDPQGTIVRSSINIDEYKVKASDLISE
jgi:hypothetical protein